MEDFVKDCDVGHFLDVKADVPVHRRDPLKLTRLKTSAVTHVCPPNDVELACSEKL